jgi:hypothetical protein
MKIYSIYPKDQERDTPSIQTNIQTITTGLAKLKSCSPFPPQQLPLGRKIHFTYEVSENTE